MSKILKTHPKSVQAHKDLILLCLDDKDESIRLRALDLLYGMVILITEILLILENFRRITIYYHSGVQEEFDGNCQETDGAHGSCRRNAVP